MQKHEKYGIESILGFVAAILFFGCLVSFGLFVDTRKSEINFVNAQYMQLEAFCIDPSTLQEAGLLDNANRPTEMALQSKICIKHVPSNIWLWNVQEVGKLRKD